MGDVSAEPSMEDILSSIKRIIAEEGDGTTPVRNKRPREPRPEPRGESKAEAASVASAQSTDDDDDDEILELSDPVPTPDHDDPAAMLRGAESILSSRTAAASRGALEALSRMIVKPETAGADTLEGLVREMLRPMLSEWLDANLPDLVEQMVAKEIARITSQAS